MALQPNSKIFFTIVFVWIEKLESETMTQANSFKYIVIGLSFIYCPDAMELDPHSDSKALHSAKTVRQRRRNYERKQEEKAYQFVAKKTLKFNEVQNELDKFNTRDPEIFHRNLVQDASLCCCCGTFVCSSCIVATLLGLICVRNIF